MVVMSSYALKALIVARIDTTSVVGASSGIVILRNEYHGEAPSTFAASYSYSAGANAIKNALTSGQIDVNSLMTAIKNYAGIK